MPEMHNKNGPSVLLCALNMKASVECKLPVSLGRRADERGTEGSKSRNNKCTVSGAVGELLRVRRLKIDTTARLLIESGPLDSDPK